MIHIFSFNTNSFMFVMFYVIFIYIVTIFLRIYIYDVFGSIGIDNLNGRSRLAQLHQILKEVKLAYEREKMKIKSCGSVISFPSSKNSHGTDDTMSNDSERSDDSLLNDFEVLKPRSRYLLIKIFSSINDSSHYFFRFKFQMR